MIFDFFLGAVLVAFGIAFLHALLAHRDRSQAKKNRALFDKDAARGVLGRAHDNPILPRGTEPWEAEAVMNPAAVDDGERTHLFYRAIGADGVSRIGYASAADGVSIDERLPYPVFALADESSYRTRLARMVRHPGLVASGGSWGGAEDPRAVLIDGRLYLTFQAFRGWDSVRIGVTSLSLDNLHAKNFDWSEPVYLSAPNEVHKNWVLFPEKINAKFALFHGLESRTRDRAQIAYLDTLDTEPAEYIRSDAGFRNTTDPHSWDTRIRGAGAPPVRTPYGWLVLYHANDKRDSSQYKVGGMLLDDHDPSKVLARSKRPVLSPHARYENEGAKSGVVYTSGAVIKGDDLIVYYGAADTVVCAAAASMKHFVRNLLVGEPSSFSPLRA